MAREPQSANDYDDRTTEAARSVLIEIGQILGSYQGKFALIGGSVPGLLIEAEDMKHVGTLDVDLSLDHEALDDGEYKTLVEALMGQGYEKTEETKAFQLVRKVPARDGGPDIDIVVDFLMARDAVIKKNRPPLIENFAVQRADGAGLAIKYNELIEVSGAMPDGGGNVVKIAVASIPALLAMKGHALDKRKKYKDAYDVYYCIRNYPGGIPALVEEPLLAEEVAHIGFAAIAAKFRAADHYGPNSVRKFVEESDILEERTAAQWQQDAFGQVDAWVLAMGLR
ncbi:MAG: nucleotidyl transferase AbiEii/AbiGii toxin family protein [Terricaulis sp.]